MRTLFADASYWIALVNPKDSLHQAARELSSSLSPAFLVTSEMVLAELLDGVAKEGGALRMAAVSLVERLRRASEIQVIFQSSEQFRDALALYAARPDKAWGLTDCASFRIMQAEGIFEALTHDHHFAQAGFRPLLQLPS